MAVAAMTETNNRKVLYLTESTFNFSQINPSSTLVDKYKPDLPPGVYHTSLGDLAIDEIIQVAVQFDSVEFEPKGFDPSSTIYKETISLYRFLSGKINGVGDIEQFTEHPLINSRSGNSMLWVFGCSHSHGVGLRPTEKNYGQHLAEELELPVNLITKPGSSLYWSYRHLFNSDIKENDIVIWQLTTPGRVSKFNGKHVQEIVLNNSTDRKLVDSITHEQLYFNQLSLLNTGVRYLRKVGCRFVIISISDFCAGYDYVSEYIKYPEYCSNFGLHLDYGTDKIHAGPLSHKAIAQRLLTRV